MKLSAALASASTAHVQQNILHNLPSDTAHGIALTSVTAAVYDTHEMNKVANSNSSSCDCPWQHFSYGLSTARCTGTAGRTIPSAATSSSQLASIVRLAHYPAATGADAGSVDGSLLQVILSCLCYHQPEKH